MSLWTIHSNHDREGGQTHQQKQTFQQRPRRHTESKYLYNESSCSRMSERSRAKDQHFNCYNYQLCVVLSQSTPTSLLYTKPRCGFIPLGKRRYHFLVTIYCLFMHFCELLSQYIHYFKTIDVWMTHSEDWVRADNQQFTTF